MTVAGCRSVVDSTYAAREGFTESTPLEEINEHLDCLVDYRNFARYKFSGFEIYTTFKIQDCHYRKMI